MSNRSSNGFRLTWFSLLVFLLFGFSSLPLAAQQSQSSTPNSQASQSSWETLKQLADTLPLKIKSYDDSLLQQLKAQENLNNSLTETNQSLMSKIADLQASLNQSQVQVEASKQQLQKLGDSLTASMQSTTEAQKQAVKLAWQTRFMKLGLAVTITGLVVETGYLFVKNILPKLK